MKLKIVLAMVILLVLYGQASAGQYSINGTPYYPLYDGTHSPSHIENLSYNSVTGDYDFRFDSGWIRLKSWTGGRPIDYILNPINGLPISMYSGWKSESYRTSGQGSWIEMTPISMSLTADLNNKRVTRFMTTTSGGMFNVTYAIVSGKLKISVERTAGTEGRAQRVRYDIDIINGQGKLLNSSKQFNPELAYNVSMLWDYSDITNPNHTVSQFISGGGTRYNFVVDLYNKSVMSNGNKDGFDPSWTINGSTASAWQNATNEHTAVNNKNVVIGLLRDTFTDGEVTSSPNWTQLSTPTVSSERLQITGIASDERITYNFSENNYRSNGTRLAFWIKNETDMSGNNDYSPKIYNNYVNSTYYHGYQMYSQDGDFRHVPKINNTDYYDTTRQTNIWDGIDHYIEIYRYNNGSSRIVKDNTYFAMDTAQATLLFDLINIGFGANLDVGSDISYDDISLMYLDSNNILVTLGNLTTWYDSGSGNEVYQIDVNATTPENTNYTLTVMNNDTDMVIQTWTNQTGNNSFTITGAVQDTKINVTLNGNTTTTPELIQITFFDQAAGEEEGDFIPPTPINCLSSNGTTWINLSCSSGTGNITNSMNFTNINLSTWNNNSAFYWNNTGLTGGTLYDYRIYAYNSSGTGSLNLTYATISNTTLATTIEVNVYNTGWQFLLVNSSMTTSQFNNNFSVTWLDYWESASQIDQIYYAGWPYRSSLSMSAGSGVMAEFSTNKTLTMTLEASYNWTLNAGWNLQGLEVTKTLAQINTSINNECINDQIYYINLDTQVESLFTCGSAGNATVSINAGEAVFINKSTTGTSDVVRTWV